MLHSTDNSKDVRKEHTKDYGDDKKVSLLMEKFHPISDLAKDGFIHEDGSLRFQFFIKKHQLRKQLQ